MTLLLSGSEVQQALRMGEAIDIVERGFMELGEGSVDMPQRPVILVPERHGLCAFMPALVRDMGALAIKTVTAFKENVKRGLPTILGTVALLDPETGALLCVMDAGYLTAVRTGAASGVATKYLARDDASVAAIIGAGVQGRTQLEALCSVRKIDDVRVYDIDAEKAESYAAEMSGIGLVPDHINVSTSAQDALAGADIVATATTSPTPVVDGDHLSPGMHINGVGSHTRDARELDTKTVVNSKIVCDAVEACLAEAGDLLIPMDEGVLKREDIHGGLADVTRGKLPGRESDQEITLFKSVGLAFEDAAVALHTYQKAHAMGLGTEFQF